MTTAPVPFLVAGVGLVGVMLGWFVNGLGYLVKRKLTGAPESERAAYLNNVTDLAAKLHASGMTVDDVHAFEAVLRNPAVVSSEAASKVVGCVNFDDEPDAFHSNFAMKSRARSAYDLAEARLAQALTDLRLLSGGDDEKLHEVQIRWMAYRAALEDREMAKYEGGSHAILAVALAGLAETERRTDEVLAEVSERLTR